METHHKFENISNCRTDSRENQTVICSFDGGLIKTNDPFPYFMLLAFESGSVLRALLLLFAYPVSIFFKYVVSYQASLQMMIFITFCGLKASCVEKLSKTVLCKSYMEDLNPSVLSAFSSFVNKCVITEVPNILVEQFLKEYLSVDLVIGSQLLVNKDGYCTGLTESNHLLTTGIKRLEALKEVFTRNEISADVGFGNGALDYPFMSWCKEAYQIGKPPSVPISPQQYPKPLIFHDGRLAILPTPPVTLTLFLWLPFALILALLRLIASYLPYKLRLPIGALLGMKVRVKGSPPQSSSRGGTLFVTSHRTLLDPIVLSAVLNKRLTAVTYSISRLSEIICPYSIRTVRLSRDRSSDGPAVRRLLRTDDVVICPEGTTCREPYLLRFSPMFAELSDRIVPVMMHVRTGLFYGTTAGGRKWLDPFFFCMDVKPCYIAEFLEELPYDMTCGGGKTSVEVANYVQMRLGHVSGFKCTWLTRKDKYRFLAGNDG